MVPDDLAVGEVEKFHAESAEIESGLLEGLGVSLGLG